MDMRSSESWRLFLTVAVSAIAAFVVTFSVLNLLDITRSRTRNTGAPVAARLPAPKMEDVIFTASERLSGMADDKLSLTRSKNQDKQSENEQLLKRLNAWMDKGTNR
jgi:hypothetical protein